MEVAAEVDLTLNSTSDLTVIFTLNDPSGQLLSRSTVQAFVSFSNHCKQIKTIIKTWSMLT